MALFFSGLPDIGARELTARFVLSLLWGARACVLPSQPQYQRPLRHLVSKGQTNIDR